MTTGTDNFLIKLGLPVLPSDNIPKELYDNFFQLHRAIQNLLRGVSQYCGIDPPASDLWDTVSYQETLLSGNLTRLYPVADVAIARGQVVNLFNSGGELKARLAAATSASTAAHGVANSAALAGQRFEMNWLRATLDSIGGLTTGSLYWLSPTPGAVQAIIPSGGGQIQQPVGVALAATTLLLDIPLSYRQL